jgi:tryptophan synthase beta chain
MPDDILNSFMTGPDEKGRFGDFGGRFVSETLMPLILELEAQYENAKTDQSFWDEMDDLWTNYVGRPSPLYFAERLTDRLGGAKIYFKRDELNHTGAHKINNVLGQIILARRMGKTRIIAETGAGQHGVATATVCAKFGLKCIVYMGATDVERQAPNVFRMKLLGAEVVPGHLRARHAQGRDERRAARLGHQCARHVLLHRHGGGPAPVPGHGPRFPGDHRQGNQAADHGGRGPPARHDHRRHRRRVERDGPVLSVPRRHRGGIIGVEAGGKGVNAKMEHCASLTGGRPGVLHGNRTYLLQDEDGQILEGHSISAGLDYPGIGPEHAWLHDIGRAEYVSITDTEALEAFQLCCETEGIIPALEPSHALAHVAKIAPDLPSDHLIVMNMCGRGDKDIFTVARALGWDMEGY